MALPCPALHSAWHLTGNGCVPWYAASQPARAAGAFDETLGDHPCVISRLCCSLQPLLLDVNLLHPTPPTTTTLLLPRPRHEFKLVVSKKGECFDWEGGANRVVEVGARLG